MSLFTATLLLACAPALPAGEAKLTVHAPELYVQGGSFRVRIAAVAPAEGAQLEGWKPTPAGFAIDGKPVAGRKDEPPIELKAGETRTWDLDLGPQIQAKSDFELVFGDLPARKVRVLEPASKDLKFVDEKSVATEDLAKYWALLETNSGQMLVEFHPDLAPNHVRNFLDLSSTGFYKTTTFHRVKEGFMIQGGDPTGTGGGSGPRMLKLEPSSRKHVRGTLSMARSSDPNSASCQFFVMHGAAPFLDGKYSVFGSLVSGFDTLDRIANAPGKAAQDGTRKPNEQQVILDATAVKIPADPDSWREQAAPKPPAAPNAPAGK